MKFNVLAITLAFAATATGLAFAQEAPRASLHVYSDQFISKDGVVVYSQYTWNTKIPTGYIGGYGLGEAAPHEQFFTNHLVVYTPNAANWSSVHTESGGAPNAGTHFFQVGPRINATNAIHALRRPMDHLFVAILPRFIGVRPNNLLAAGATNQFKITQSTQGWIEGYCRFFPGGAYNGECWLMGRAKKQTHVAWGVFVHDNSRKPVSVGLGMRISLF